MARVLIVEDDAAIAGLYRDRLTLDGHTVVVAEGGKAGLDAALSGRPDIILLDVQLPDFDGMTLLKRLRADERDRGTPVILLTNTTAPEGLNELEGMYSDYLIKVDLALDELAAKVTAYTGA